MRYFSFMNHQIWGKSDLLTFLLKLSETCHMGSNDEGKTFNFLTDSGSPAIKFFRTGLTYIDIKFQKSSKRPIFFDNFCGRK
jgi:hypothetical protein